MRLARGRSAVAALMRRPRPLRAGTAEPASGRTADVDDEVVEMAGSVLFPPGRTGSSIRHQPPGAGRTTKSPRVDAHRSSTIVPAEPPTPPRGRSIAAPISARPEEESNAWKSEAVTAGRRDRVERDRIRAGRAAALARDTGARPRRGREPTRRLPAGEGVAREGGPADLQRPRELLHLPRQQRIRDPVRDRLDRPEVDQHPRQVRGDRERRQDGSPDAEAAPHADAPMGGAKLSREQLCA
jgi:hypothetical protein